MLHNDSLNKGVWIFVATAVYTTTIWEVSVGTQVIVEANKVWPNSDNFYPKSTLCQSQSHILQKFSSLMMTNNIFLFVLLRAEKELS